MEPSLDEGDRMSKRMNILSVVSRAAGHVWTVTRRAVKKFFHIDGLLWAGAFSFNAFLSLFPVLILLVTIASYFIDRNRVVAGIVDYLQNYVPISGEMQGYVFDTIAGVIKARGPASAIAFILMTWVASQCFSTLIRAANRAWGTSVRSWWHLPVKSMILLGLVAVTAFAGSTVSVAAAMAKEWFPFAYDFQARLYGLAINIIPLLVVFLSLVLFYRFAPHRRTSFEEIWAGAITATVLLRCAEKLFGIYLRDIASINAVYGVFGSIIALLIWINMSGIIIILGACVCAVRAEMRSAGQHPSPARKSAV